MISHYNVLYQSSIKYSGAQIISIKWLIPHNNDFVRSKYKIAFVRNITGNIVLFLQYLDGKILELDVRHLEEIHEECNKHIRVSHVFDDKSDR